jgi:sodium pump decarboxylase gamma subunit
MSSNITTSFLITAIGMGLVFGAILVLWGAMAALVKLAEKWSNRTTTEAQHVENVALPTKDNRKLAAAIGAAYAIAHHKQSTVHEFPLPSMAFVTAWQAVMRSKNFSRRR